MVCAMTANCRRVPFPADDPPVLVFDLGPAFSQLPHDHIHGLQDVEGLET